MNSFIIYSIEIAISLALFYTAYWLFLKNETFFKLNRFYLLFSVVVSLLTPLININIGADSFINKNFILPIEHYEQNILGGSADQSVSQRSKRPFHEKDLNPIDEKEEGLDQVDGVVTDAAPNNLSNSDDTTASYKNINWLTVMLVIYFIGVALFFIRFMANFIWIFAYALKHKPQSILGAKVIKLEKNISPFSFLNFIFMSHKDYPKDELDKIIFHEKVHIKQKHSVDLILFELLLVIQWFNPFVWFYKSAMKITHEYLADLGTLNSGIDLPSYQYSLLNQVLSENNFEITSNYNISIKKRINMMMKKRSSKLATLKLSIALPVISILFSAFAFKSITTKNNVTPNLSNGNKPIVNDDTTIKRVNVPVEYLKLLEGEYVSTNEPGRVRKIIFTELLGTIHGWDNGYSYKIIPVGDGKFINPDDNATLEFDTKDKNAISLLLFGKIILKKLKLEKDKFAYGSRPGNLSLAYPLANMMLKDGIPAALSYLKVRIDSIYLAEHEMNFAGYDLLKGEKTKEAAAMFKLNTEMYPNSFNTFDSYAEALMLLGEKTLAIENYKKSLQLNPGSRRGLKKLKELGINTDELIKKVKVMDEYLKLLEGEYLATNEPNSMRLIKFTVKDGVLWGNDNDYEYELIPMGGEKFINPDDGASLVFNTKDKNAMSLLLFGKINLKKVKLPKVSDEVMQKYIGVYQAAPNTFSRIFKKDDGYYQSADGNFNKMYFLSDSVYFITTIGNEKHFMMDSKGNVKGYVRIMNGQKLAPHIRISSPEALNGNEELFNNIARSFLDVKDFEGANMYMLRGLALHPNSVSIQGNLAHSYLFAGKYDKAIAIYKSHLTEKVNNNTTMEQMIQRDFVRFKNNGFDKKPMDKVFADLKLEIPESYRIK